ncbi:MAG: cardiolipin synthase ClsB [Tibeticola sp.]
MAERPAAALLQGARGLFAALIEAFDAAQHEILLETYIFDTRGSAAEIAAALVRAAQRGVAVHLAVDGVGTPEWPAPWGERFAAAGVQLAHFAPTSWLGLLRPSRWHRLHRKLCVVDRALLFCGGINILDDHHDPNHGPLAQPRLDFAVVVRGAPVPRARALMARLAWRAETAQRVRAHPVRGTLDALLDARQAPPRPAGPAAVGNSHAGSPAQTAQTPVQALWQRGGEGWPLRPVRRAALLLRDNLRHRTQIERAYRRAIAAAREEVVLASAYFLPGRRLRRALQAAARRGVRVRVLMQGRYEYFFEHHGARAMLAPLLAAGVEVYEYLPSFLHAKVAVVDAHGERAWATVGSSNLEPLSLLLALEANVVVEDAGFARALHASLDTALREHSRRLDAQALERRPWAQRLLDRLALALVRLALTLTGRRY